MKDNTTTIPVCQSSDEAERWGRVKAALDSFNQDMAARGFSALDAFEVGMNIMSRAALSFNDPFARDTAVRAAMKRLKNVCQRQNRELRS